MTVIREIVLLLSVFCALFGNAQTSLSDRLYKILVSQDIDLGLNLYREITLTDIQQLPDSSLFNYHYLGGWCNSEISNHEKAIEHCLEAKHLCESHLGILNYEYMEIMVVMGREYKALGKYEDALAIYEEGLVKSHYARKSVTVPYCSLIMGIIDCLELMGWFNEIPALLSDAWFFWDKDETPLVTYTYYPLWYLEQIYKRYGMHENALLVSAEIESFIKSKGGENHPELAEALYFKGNILDEMNRTDDSIKAFQEGLEILSGNGLENSELYGMLAGNLFIALISSACFEEGDDLLERIQQYSITNSTNTYRKALLSAANIVGAICNYDKALRYNDILLTSNINSSLKNYSKAMRHHPLSQRVL